MDKSPSGENQAEEVLEMIQDIVSQNNGSFYTNELYALAEKHIQKRENKIVERRNSEMKDEIEKIGNKMSKKNLSSKETERERKEIREQIEDKYAKLPDPRHQVRINLSEVGSAFLGMLVGVLGTLSLMRLLVIKLMSMFR